MRRGWLGVCALALLAACSLQDRLVHCGDTLCPFGSTCTTDNRCAAPVDAQFFDAPVDAPFACPALGAGSPKFSLLWHQELLGQGCHDYNVSATGTAVAACSDVQDHIDSGPVDQPMTALPGFEVAPSPFSYPRITVEGDAMFVLDTPSSMPAKIDRYTYSPSGWLFANSIAQPAIAIGAPSAQPDRHMFYVEGNFAHEVQLADTTVTSISVYTNVELGVQTISGPPNLSPDGLRMVFAGSGPVGRVHMFYAERATINVRFNPSMPIPNAPIETSDPFLTSDCARLYFSAAGSVFYAQQD